MTGRRRRAAAGATDGETRGRSGRARGGGERAPQQRRSQEKRERLVKAGIAVFARDGYEAARVQDIVAEAGISVGVFYQRFRDKRGFFEVLEAEFVERGKANWDRFFATADPDWTPRELFERLMRNLGRTIERNIGFFRALITVGHHDKTVVPSAVEMDRHGARRLEAYLIEHGIVDGERLRPDQVYFGLATVVKSLVVTAAMEAGPYKATGETTARELARMLADYLDVELD